MVTMRMSKAGVSALGLIMETIPVRCAALSVCNDDYNVTVVTSATVENPFKKSLNTHKKHTH